MINLTVKLFFMLEHLEKWMYINDIYNENLKKIAEYIEKTNKKPIILTSKAFILEYFYLLLNDKISVEDFYMFWDVYKDYECERFFIKNPYDAFFYLKNKNWIGDFVVFDEIFRSFWVKDNFFYC